jgi:hypothetical protein
MDIFIEPDQNHPSGIRVSEDAASLKHGSNNEIIWSTRGFQDPVTFEVRFIGAGRPNFPFNSPVFNDANNNTGPPGHRPAQNEQDNGQDKGGAEKWNYRVRVYKNGRPIGPWLDPGVIIWD